MRTCRIYPRMAMGGVENAVLQYLEASGSDTRMVVTHTEGMRAPAARDLAAEYRFLGDGSPRLPRLLSALRGVQIAHLHVINHDLLGALAAQLAGTPKIVQTLHNHFSPSTEILVDHTICVGIPVREMVAAPLRSTVIPNGVEGPDALPVHAPWYSDGRPLRILELRRPDKEMVPSLEDVAASGGLDGYPVELRVAGFSRDDGVAGVTYLGPLSDPSEELAAADLVLHASRFDTFGRVAYEALAWGAMPVLARDPWFTTVFGDDEVVFIDGDRSPLSVATQLRRAAEWLAANPEAHAERRRRGHNRVRHEFSVGAMVERTDRLLSSLTPAARSFAPSDIVGVDLEELGAVLDQTLYGPGPADLRRLTALPGRAAAVAGWAAVMAGRVRQPMLALQLMQQVQEILGPRPAVCMTYARALEQMGHRAQAATWMLRAARGRPQHVVAWLEAVALLAELGELSQARRVLDAAVAANPGEERLLSMRARFR